ncbi:PREDICTED: uncharacterized protein LOC107326983 isoform X2 [Acropora digitifera]|uniref:uncharacterized protein LOC107326983 isoform X2 n=1 Tax=Acropora digitifera TaxID=70779 RepID=UPI00077A4922|nr:PREDICTED: uncharacterized protein LOC107326983 isoform X2 [Acropora digitifera]
MRAANMSCESQSTIVSRFWKDFKAVLIKTFRRRKGFRRLSEPPQMRAAKMFCDSQSPIVSKLRKDFRAVLIKTFRELNDKEEGAVWFYYDKTILKNICETFEFLIALEEAEEISWTNISSLKTALSIIKREDLVDDLENFRIKRNVALLLDAFVRIRKGIPRQNLSENIEAIAWYLANLTDCALDKSKVRLLRKSKTNIEEVIICLEEKIRETSLSKHWSKRPNYRLALLIVAAGEVLSETETNNEEFEDPLPEDVIRCSAEICSSMTSLDEWDAFCHYVKERYNKVYRKDDKSDDATDVKKIADEIIVTLIQIRLFQEPGNTPFH